MKNLGTYFEIPVTDLNRAIKFYSNVFECEFVQQTIHNCEMAFFPFDQNSSGITGALVKGEIYKPSKSGCIIYFQTSDISRVLTKVISIGGAELFPKTLVPNMGYSAEFEDSEGNRICLLYTSPSPRDATLSRMPSSA